MTFLELAIAKALFFTSILVTATRLCPCASGDVYDDALCEGLRRRVVHATAVVAYEDDNPSDVVARLLGTVAHETGCRTDVQDHGPAVTPWQLEVSVAQRAALLADDLKAAHLALVRARTCGGSMRGYATGTCQGGGARGAEIARQIANCVESARRGGAWPCRNWYKAPDKKRKGRRK